MSIQRYDHDTSSDCYGMRRTEDGDFVKYEDHRAAMAQLPLPNPSADEEVERLAGDMKEAAARLHWAIRVFKSNGDFDKLPWDTANEWLPHAESVTTRLLNGAEELIQLRQQHNAEREEFIESAVARDKKADEDRDAYESLINELKAQLEAARTQCALRSAGHDDLRTRLNKANAQKTALYFENSDALAELQQLRASLAEKERENTQLKRENENTWRAHGQIVSQLSALQSELATAQAEKHGLEDVVLATRNMSIEAFDRIRALIGASPNDPRPCETLVSELIESLRSQLQTAMEERDAANKKVIYFDNLLDEREAKHAENLSAINSRLEEALSILTQIKERRPFPADQTDVYDWMNQAESLIDGFLSHLSSSRPRAENMAIQSAAKAVVNHWNEFGPEHGFEETIHYLEKALKSSSSRIEDEKIIHFMRGYFCACAVYVKEQGMIDTHADSMIRQGGDWTQSDPQDIATFEEHGLSRLSTSRETENKT